MPSKNKKKSSRYRQRRRNRANTNSDKEEATQVYKRPSSSLSDNQGRSNSERTNGDKEEPAPIYEGPSSSFSDKQERSNRKKANGDKEESAQVYEVSSSSSSHEYSPFPMNIKLEILHQVVQEVLSEKRNEEIMRIHIEHSMSPGLRKLKVDKKFKLSKSDTILGEGQFGVVTRGELFKCGETLNVAIKEATFGHSRMLYEEAEIMSELNHENLVKILGIQTTPTFSIIMEFMELGDIKKCLLEQKKDLFSLKQLIHGLLDISLGMEYLTKKKIVHIDLAVRNILVNPKLEFKIGDFGIARKIEENSEFYVWDTRKGKLAMYNMAPEAEETLTFSWRTDVWSMGLLIWEVFQLYSLHSTAYEYHLYFFRLQRSVLPRPKECPLDIYFLAVKRMMHENPFRRPTFTEVKDNLSQHSIITSSK